MRKSNVGQEQTAIPTNLRYDVAAQKLPGLPTSTSVFLDTLRVTAALTVFAVHCLLLWYHTDQTKYGHSAVVVFFVLSGYVIAFSSLTSKRNIKSYVLARLSRLYSVVIPALALTFVLCLFGMHCDPTLYKSFERGNGIIRYCLAGLFLAEVWKLNANPLTNMPLWSLGYEFWYYAIFGAAIFVEANLWRLIVIGAIALFVGPKVLLLMPVWLMGAALFVYGNRIVLPPFAARLGLFLAVPAAAFAFVRMPAAPFPVGSPPLYWSGAFLSDWVAGLVVATVIWLFHHAFGQSPVPICLVRSVRWAGSHTFSLYLYHAPLLIFVTATGCCPITIRPNQLRRLRPY